MTYYFPVGANITVVPLNISLANSAVTASAPSSSNITAITASFAAASGSVPQNGTNGANAIQSVCQADFSKYISGSKGLQGPTGSKGIDNLTCPPGTIECTQLNVSLSANYLDAFTSGANAYVPSGSQYSIVCMQIPPNCGNPTCPPYLPMGNYPVIQ